VLEKEGRVGGRMVTDRVQGFDIDTGVTLLGGRFSHMLRLVHKYGLGSTLQKKKLSLGVVEQFGAPLSVFRSGRVDDVVLNKNLSPKSKAAMLSFGAGLLWNSNRLLHGQSHTAVELDNEDCGSYMSRIGGKELLEKVFVPGLNGATCGDFNSTSKLVFMQTFWNLLMTHVWTIAGGVQRIPEALAEQVDVMKQADVKSIERTATGVRLVTELGLLHAKAVILAIPGNRITGLCSFLPASIKTALDSTTYSKVVNVHVALKGEPGDMEMGIGFSKQLEAGAVIECEQLRARCQCPEGHYMLSVFMWNTEALQVTALTDEAVQARAIDLMESTFPGSKEKIVFTHVVRWEDGIAKFKPGRLQKMAELRKQMETWDLPLQLCGDYLDGLSSEGALVTGEQAAERIADYLAKTRTH
jgi:oxygen-dependent protoporphyrinogen oxidase